MLPYCPYGEGPIGTYVTESSPPISWRLRLASESLEAKLFIAFVDSDMDRLHSRNASPESRPEARRAAWDDELEALELVIDQTEVESHDQLLNCLLQKTWNRIV